MTTSPERNDAASQDTAGGDTSSAGNDAVVSQEILRDLAQSIGLLPQAPPSGDEQPPEDGVMLPVIEQDGTRYIPVFTSEDALRAAGGDPATAVRLPIAQLAAQWPSDDLWLAVNPASEQGVALPPDLVRALPIFAQSTPNGGGGASDSADSAVDTSGSAG
jgi:hypothetical protein